MKVSVRNLGVIKEAQIDLKPLTVFIRPNNAGKKKYIRRRWGDTLGNFQPGFRPGCSDLL